MTELDTTESPEEEELNRMAMSDREANWDELITIDEKMEAIEAFADIGDSRQNGID